MLGIRGLGKRNEAMVIATWVSRQTGRRSSSGSQHRRHSWFDQFPVDQPSSDSNSTKENFAVAVVLVSVDECFF